MSSKGLTSSTLLSGSGCLGTKRSEVEGARQTALLIVASQAPQSGLANVCGLVVVLTPTQQLHQRLVWPQTTAFLGQLCSGIKRSKLLTRSW